MTRFLENLNIERYGALANRSIGPLSEGLNIVFGPNEAGKSTAASFVGGVLFGWENAHGVKNTYQPETGDRAGELVFSDGSAVRRGPHADSLEGDTSIVGDVDSATYKTMFSLTSDELRSLRDTSDIAARLLSAGSGTGASPTGAYVEIEQRIAALTTRAADAPRSIFNLEDKLDEQHERVKQLNEEVELRKQEGRELKSLHEDRVITARHLSDVNAELEKLGHCRVRVERIDEQLAEERQALLVRDSNRAESMLEGEGGADIDPRLLELDAASERALRDRLDELADEQAKAARGVDIAKENAEASTAAYEALMEMGASQPRERSARRSKNSLAALPAVLAVAFALAGIPVFVHARSINSLSLSAFGIGLVVFACLLAVATVALVARPDRSAEALSSRQQDAQWIMLQDKKKLSANTTTKKLVDQKIAEFLENAGLGAAGGSIRQARALLDDAQKTRSANLAQSQRLASIDMRIAATQETIAELLNDRKELVSSVGLSEQSDLTEIDVGIAMKADQREALAQTCEDMSMRIGQLSERLERARADRSFDQAKLAHQQTRVRLRDAKRELVTLLLAKSMLEKSIVAWESRSQPGVYRKASELFEIVTDGAWRQISMTADGHLVATAADGTLREIRHLSLGTCQQLYLSLRIAMLLHAQNVGRSIPVLADDILVNFDAARRLGAARALAQLAATRQVIVFTCHQETVDSLLTAQPDANRLDM